jgi:hypothetical protein
VAEGALLANAGLDCFASLAMTMLEFISSTPSDRMGRGHGLPARAVHREQVLEGAALTLPEISHTFRFGNCFRKYFHCTFQVLARK